MTNLIKARKANPSARGIYIQDKELLETVFQVGSYFEYAYSEERGIVEVLPSKEKGKNTVSKRKMKDFIKPVIDIRVKSVLACLEGADEYQIEIYSDKIRIIAIDNQDVDPVGYAKELEEAKQDQEPTPEVIEEPEVIENLIAINEEQDQLTFDF